MTLSLSLIVALDQNGLIGRANDLPWRLPADLKHFKKITMGRTIIMGRKTAESIGRPLPGRRNVVLTRRSDFIQEGFDCFHGVEPLLQSLQATEHPVVIGGAEVYRALWPYTTKAYVTLVEGLFEGDTWFPEWPLAGWRETSAETYPPDGANGHAMTFFEYEKLERV